MIKNIDNVMLNFGAVVFRKTNNNEVVWLLVKNESGKWEIPKSVVRKRESSVRAVLRTMGEQGGISCEVLEEVGRNEDFFSINGKKTARLTIYYLILAKNKGEILGFGEASWDDFNRALKKIGSAKEKEVFKQAGVEFNERFSNKK